MTVGNFDSSTDGSVDKTFNDLGITVSNPGGDALDYSNFEVELEGAPTGLTVTFNPTTGTFNDNTAKIDDLTFTAPAGTITSDVTVTVKIKHNVATITTLDCAGASFAPNQATEGIAYNGTLTISYTNGNGGSYNQQSVSSTGITGLIATLTEGNVANGNGNVAYSISGTPSGAGTASFAITFAGKTCEFNIDVVGQEITCNHEAVKIHGFGDINVPEWGGQLQVTKISGGGNLQAGNYGQIGCSGGPSGYHINKYTNGKIRITFPKPFTGRINVYVTGQWANENLLVSTDKGAPDDGGVTYVCGTFGFYYSGDELGVEAGSFYSNASSDNQGNYRGYFVVSNANYIDLEAEATYETGVWSETGGYKPEIHNGFWFGITICP